MADSILRKRITDLPLETRSLYSFCTNIKKSGNYSETISDITYDIEAVITNIVDDTNISTIFSDISNDESKFLLLKAKNINISGTLTPPYPKKSLIIFCPNIIGTGTISMTGKGPNTLPQDILLFEDNEIKEINKVLIPAYANNAKTMSLNSETSTASNLEQVKALYKGNNGTNYNCGSGGIGGHVTRWSSTVKRTGSSAYSYGGGAGLGGLKCGGDYTDTFKNTSYPMIGGNYTADTGYYGCSSGIGNPNGSGASAGTYGWNASTHSKYNSAKGVGGRLIIFCKDISISNLTAQGITYQPQTSHANADAICANGGSSGGGSINVFYKTNMSSTCNVNGGESSRHTCSYDYGPRNIGGAGGDGTIVSIQCSNIRYK